MNHPSVVLRRPIRANAWPYSQCSLCKPIIWKIGMSGSANHSNMPAIVKRIKPIKTIRDRGFSQSCQKRMVVRRAHSKARYPRGKNIVLSHGRSAKMSNPTPQAMETSHRGKNHIALNRIIPTPPSHF
jgi:hypothetical protein